LDGALSAAAAVHAIPVLFVAGGVLAARREIARQGAVKRSAERSLRRDG
jgi:hypothetical protein